jgi:hypothetical protein
MLGGLWSPQATLVMGELKPPQLQDLTAFLQLVGCTVQGEHPGPQDEVSNQKLFATAYFLVSALSGMETKAKERDDCWPFEIVLSIYASGTQMIISVEDLVMWFPPVSPERLRGRGRWRVLDLREAGLFV